MTAHQELPKAAIIDQMNDWIYQAYVLRAALELQLWAKVAAGLDTVERLAAQEGWNPTGVRMLLDAICGFGLLTRQASEAEIGPHHCLTPEAEHYLRPDRPTYKGDMILSGFVWEGNGQLATAVRTGQRPIGYLATTEQVTGLWIADYARSWADPDWWLEQADALWRSLNIQPRDGLRVLDVACEPAPKSLALARLHPGVRVTLLNWETILQTALQVAARLQIDGQVVTLAGDLWSADYGANQFDVVWLGNITHFFSPEENVRLFRRAYDALVSGGALVVNSVARRDKEFPAWIDLWLYAVTPGGAAYDWGEYKQMLEQAGYREIEDVAPQPIKAIKP